MIKLAPTWFRIELQHLTLKDKFSTTLVQALTKEEAHAKALKLYGPKWGVYARWSCPYLVDPGKEEE